MESGENSSNKINEDIELYTDRDSIGLSKDGENDGGNRSVELGLFETGEIHKEYASGFSIEEGSGYNQQDNQFRAEEKLGGGSDGDIDRLQSNAQSSIRPSLEGGIVSKTGKGEEQSGETDRRGEGRDSALMFSEAESLMMKAPYLIVKGLKKHKYRILKYLKKIKKMMRQILLKYKRKSAPKFSMWALVFQ